MSCLIIGDSIAVGIAMYLTQCDKQARVGMSSTYIERNYRSDKCYDAVIISAGSNDPSSPKLRGNLLKIRENLCASKYIWVAPINRIARGHVSYMGNRFRDVVVTFAPGRDNVHPRNYRTLANQVRLNF